MLGVITVVDSPTFWIGCILWMFGFIDRGQ